MLRPSQPRQYLNLYEIFRSNLFNGLNEAPQTGPLRFSDLLVRTCFFMLRDVNRRSGVERCISGIGARYHLKIPGRATGREPDAGQFNGCLVYSLDQPILPFQEIQFFVLKILQGHVLPVYHGLDVKICKYPVLFIAEIGCKVIPIT